VKNNNHEKYYQKPLVSKDTSLTEIQKQTTQNEFLKRKMMKQVIKKCQSIQNTR